MYQLVWHTIAPHIKVGVFDDNTRVIKTHETIWSLTESERITLIKALGGEDPAENMCDACGGTDKSINEQ